MNVQGMYDSNYSIAKIIFLHIFQVMVSTVILNILLAVIVQIFDEASTCAENSMLDVTGLKTLMLSALLDCVMQAHTMGKAHQIRRRAGAHTSLRAPAHFLSSSEIRNHSYVMHDPPFACQAAAYCPIAMVRPIPCDEPFPVIQVWFGCMPRRLRASQTANYAL